MVQFIIALIFFSKLVLKINEFTGNMEGTVLEPSLEFREILGLRSD